MTGLRIRQRDVIVDDPIVEDPLPYDLGTSALA